MTEREAPRWAQNTWRGHPNYQCTRCAFATLDIGEMRLHAKSAHPLASEGAKPEELSPLRGVRFETDRAAEVAVEAGLTAKAFDQITPSGKTGGYTTADVRSAARATT